MIIRKAKIEDLDAMLAIYNYEVLNSTATFDLQPKTYEERKVWFDEHNIGNHPLYVADINGTVVGYISLSAYRPKAAYDNSVELSIYVDHHHRNQGIASALMEFIINEARRDPSIHVIVSVITSENEASVKLHKKFGFTYCGTLKEVGYKFGRFVDISHFTLNVQ